MPETSTEGLGLADSTGAASRADATTLSSGGDICARDAAAAVNKEGEMPNAAHIRTSSPESEAGSRASRLTIHAFSSLSRKDAAELMEARQSTESARKNPRAGPTDASGLLATSSMVVKRERNISPSNSLLKSL